MNQIELAEIIATVAHASIGQKRADGVTPYIEHPRRVVEILRYELWPVGMPFLEECLAGAWMHDVIEDTGVTLDDLRNCGVLTRVWSLVDLLSKPDPSRPAGPDYYARIATSDLALIVKCADRAANLESILPDLKKGVGFSKQKACEYAMKTRRDVLPIYEKWPKLRKALERRIAEVEAAAFALS